MQVEQIVSEDLKREYNITIPSDNIKKSIDDKLKSIAKTLKKDGFRPGKVPLEVVKKDYGHKVLGEVLEKELQKTSSEALKNEGLRPAMRPKMEIIDFEEGKDLVYKIEFEILPEVPEVDFSKIEIERRIVDITDKDVDNSIEKIAESAKNFVPVKKARAAKNGDAVNIDFKGFVDDVPFDGGEAQGHQLELGSNSFIPGFEEQLVGAKKDADIVVDVKFPKEYHSEELAGKDAKFEVKINEVLEAGKNEINDEFAKILGVESVAALKEAVKSQLELETNNSSRTLVKKEIFDLLSDQYEFNVPTEMVTIEFDSIWKQVQEAKKQEPDSEEFNKSDEELEKEYKEMANRRVRLGIMLADIGSNNDIAVTQDEINQAVVSEARKYPGQEQQIFEYYSQHPEQLEALKGPILEEKVVDFLMANVKVNDKKVSIEDLEAE